jgi:Peptidase C39 family
MMTWFSQEQRNSCVAACIRMVLSEFGQILVEKRIRQLLEQSPLGLSLEKACQRLQQNGVNASWHADWGMFDLRDCLRDGWFPIVGIERRFFGHPDALHASCCLRSAANPSKFLIHLAARPQRRCRLNHSKKPGSAPAIKFC